MPFEQHPTIWKFVRPEAANMDSNPVEPPHYDFPGGVKVIDLTEHLSFCRGNVVKYVARAGRKDIAAELEDLQKARWYLDREIERLERQRRS